MNETSMRCILPVVLVVHLTAHYAFALGTEEIGNEPLIAANYKAWPGIMPVINDKARVYSRWVNGNEYFFYQGKTKELNIALANFAKIEARHHVVVFRPGPAVQTTFRRKSIPFNWQLHVLGGIAGSGAKDDPEDLDWQKWPVMTIFVDDSIELDKISIPQGVMVRSLMKTSDGTESGEATRKKLEQFLERIGSKVSK